jgi:SAM-dependent methyltransferase
VEPLDDPGRLPRLRQTIRRKAALRRLYEEFYDKYAACLARCPPEGAILELGSGAGFAADRVPGLITSDVIPYAGLDLVADGTALPFADRSLRMVCMTNVFHHVPDAAAFLAEVQRCLVPGGRLFLVDQHPGWISTPVLRHLHHEPFRPDADWAFPGAGPLSDANGALAWIVFVRDRDRLRERVPGLDLVRYAPHTPLRYWLAGGLKGWSLLPGWGFAAATRLDALLAGMSPRFGSFVDVELVRGEP